MNNIGYCLDCGRFFAVKYGVFSDLPEGHTWAGERWEDFLVEVEDAGDIFLLEHDLSEPQAQPARARVAAKT